MSPNQLLESLACTNNGYLFAPSVSELECALDNPSRFEVINGRIYPVAIGQSIGINGVRGTVTKICQGQLAGMIEIRLPSGVVCVSLFEVLNYGVLEPQAA